MKEVDTSVQCINALDDKDKGLSFPLHRKSSLTQLEGRMLISVQGKNMND